MNTHYLARTTEPMRGKPKSKSACGKTLRPNQAHTSDKDAVTCAKCATALAPKPKSRWA